MGKGSPTFSIILPTYNGSEFISDALDSIESQTIFDYELIISDDASTDDSLSVVENHSVTPDIFLKNSRNRGVARNTNRAVAKATGEFLAFLDQDDRWTSEKLETHKKAHRDKEEPLIYSDYRIINSLGEHIETSERPDALSSGNPLVKQLVNQHNIVGTMSGLTLKKQVWENLGGFDDTLRLAADWDFLLRLGSYSGFSHISNVLVEKRRHRQNLSSKRDLNYKEIIYILDKTHKRKPELSETIRKKRRTRHFNHAWEAYLNGEPQKSFTRCLRTLREHQTFVHMDTGIKPYGLLFAVSLDLLSGPFHLGRTLLRVAGKQV